MKRLIVLLALVGAVLAMTPSTAVAQEADTVSATVTPSFISLSLVSPNKDYGVLDLTATNREPTGQVCDTGTLPAFTVTNNGTSAEKFQIKGFDSTPGNWVLAGSRGANLYVHRFNTTGVATCAFTALATSNVTLVASLAKDGTLPTFLNLDMPTSSTNADGNDPQTLAITITATTPDP